MFDEGRREFYFDNVEFSKTPIVLIGQPHIFAVQNQTSARKPDP
jgi:hypothetical protein